MTVKAGDTYRFERAGYDRFFSHADVTDGDIVTVVNLRGAPPCGTMGQCHITKSDGTLLGMCDVRSLRPLKTDADYERECLDSEIEMGRRVTEENRRKRTAS